MKRIALRMYQFSSVAFGTPHGEAARGKAGTQVMILCFDFVVARKFGFKNM